MSGETLTKRRRLLLCFLPVAMACGTDDADHFREPQTFGSVRQALAGSPDGLADVIVSYRELLASGRTSGAAERHAFEEVFLGEHPSFTVSRRYESVPAIAGRVDAGELERLERDARVEWVQLDSPGTGFLKEAVPAIGGNRIAPELGKTGEGVTIAVLDSGVSTTHPDLGDAIVAQRCFTTFACPPSRTSTGTSAEDDNGHGSNVTGVITANGTLVGPGFAPGAKIVAVKVNDQNDAGRASDWVAGLDWVYQNRESLKVRVVNLSLGTNATYSSGAECDRAEPALARAVKNLVDAGVVVFVASGNRGLGTAMSAPACVTGAIAVGATYDGAMGRQPPGGTTYAGRWGSAFGNCADAVTAFDQITCFTNSNSRLDLVAPGAPVTSGSMGSRTETYWGTSQASPAAAAVAALMLECKPTLTPAEVKRILLETGVPRVDPKNGLSFPSLRAFEAVKRACGDVVPPGTGGAPGAGGAGGAGGGVSTGGVSSGAGGVSVGGSGNAGGSSPGPSGGSGGALGAGGGPASTGGTTAATGGAFPGTSGGVAGTPSTTGGTPSTGSGAGAGDDGCNCRTARTGTTPASAWLAASLVVLAARRRSRRAAR